MSDWLVSLKLFAERTVKRICSFAVIGLNNPNAFCIGDTLYCGPRRFYPGIPSFSPELFCYLHNPNPSKYKQFMKGVAELLGEGAVQVNVFTHFCIHLLVSGLNCS